MNPKNENSNTNHAMHICFDRIVPADSNSAHAVAQQAAFEHHSRELTRQLKSAGLDPSATLHVARMAVSLSKKWNNGQELKCRFLGGSAKQRKGVETKAHIWEQYANIKLKFVTTADAEIRIAFGPDPGSWSAVGIDCLVESYFPKHQPTMNFGWLTDTTPDTEYERVVVHEFGHAIGCVHEHQSPKANLQWNVQKVYEVFSGAPNYWSKAEIDSNILQKYSPKGMAETAFDEQSIMLYQFDAALFRNNHGTPLNQQLSPHDEQFIAAMYPKS